MIKFEIQPNDTLKNIECKKILTGYTYNIEKDKQYYCSILLPNDTTAERLILFINTMIRKLEDNGK